eukprot:2375504-Alexandrium_andersonii.AAC.1
MQAWGSRARVVAGQAPWQHGTTERHGGWWKEIWQKTAQEAQVDSIEEVRAAISQVNAAKNELRRRHGFSPSQLALGKNPRLPTYVVGDPVETGAHALADADEK